MSRKKLKIGLFGFGCVGAGLYEVLQKTPGLNAEIKKICVKNKNKVRSIDSSNFIYEKEVILDDPEINVVVELIDDSAAAYEIVAEAMRRGKHVVSANKKLIAEHFFELLELQKANKVSFLYEAACCASIPIIRNLEEYYDNDLLESIEGIVNGSTNYILSKIEEGAGDYETALSEAQLLGYAESDHILDTSGLDAKYKLQILLAHAFGKITRPAEIFNLGINRLDRAAFRFAKEKQFKIKLLASAHKSNEGKLICYVLPTFINAASKFYNVDGVYNGVQTKTAFSDLQFFAGKGAGAYPTASAVISDISALSYDYRYEYKKTGSAEELASPSEISLRVFTSHPGELASQIKSRYQQVEEYFQSPEYSYVIGYISLEHLTEISGKFGKQCSSVLLHETIPLSSQSETVKEKILEWA